MAARHHDAGQPLLKRIIGKSGCGNFSLVGNREAGVAASGSHRCHNAAIPAVGTWPKVSGDYDFPAWLNISNLNLVIEKAANIDIRFEVCDIGDEAA
jgi:hypothetical protein